MQALAGHKSNSFCSTTGDICQYSTKVDGVRKLRIRTAAKYFGRYKLCVTAPDGTRDCARFRMHRDGSIYKSVVRWNNRFPNEGSGPYNVKWKPAFGPGRYGRVLGFHK